MVNGKWFMDLLINTELLFIYKLGVVLFDILDLLDVIENMFYKSKENYSI